MFKEAYKSLRRHSELYADINSNSEKMVMKFVGKLIKNIIH